MIVNPVTNIPVNAKSHIHGYAQKWSGLLDEKISHKCNNLDEELFVEHGVNFSGALNLFGGANEDLYNRFENAMKVKILTSLDIDMPDYGAMIKKRIGAKTTFKGITEEHKLGEAFHEALPFTALLAVFFAIVSVIHDQHLFSPVIDYVLAQDPSVQPSMFFVANGFLSAISDNVFVATIYINEVKNAFDNGLITLNQFNNLAIAINTGTNIPSVATPNGQAAFLFLLTSSLAPLINLSYLRMVYMALPYTIVLSIVGFVSINLFL